VKPVMRPATNPSRRQDRDQDKNKDQDQGPQKRQEFGQGNGRPPTPTRRPPSPAQERFQDQVRVQDREERASTPSKRASDTDRTFLGELPLYTQCVWEVHEDSWAKFTRDKAEGALNYDEVIWPDWRGERSTTVKL